MFYSSLIIESVVYSQLVDNEPEMDLMLSKTIIMETSRLLASFKSKNQFLLGYWQYNSLKTNRLPKIN